MKILLTGGGSGGHFYPLIAVAQEIQKIAQEEKLLAPKLYYLAHTPYDERLLFDMDIVYKKISAGKIRRKGGAIKNFFDIFKTGWGIIKAVWEVFLIFPDIVFSKGGFSSFPVLVAARLFGIPVMIHESDASPGRANAWAGKFAKRIAISYPQTADLFPREKVALTGNPIRRELMQRATQGAETFLKLEPDTPTLLVLGGSQGAQTINETVLESLMVLLPHYQIIHQTGALHIDAVKQTASVILHDNPHAARYHSFGYLNVLAMRMAAGAADLVISRAGSSAIFEVAHWGLPSIIVPIPQPISHDQDKNAFAYARTGACVVIKQANLTPHILESEINRIMQDTALKTQMSQAAKAFAKPDAARTIAREVLDLVLEHET